MILPFRTPRRPLKFYLLDKNGTMAYKIMVNTNFPVMATSRMFYLLWLTAVGWHFLPPEDDF
jgi:hypothetical protein